MISTEIFTQSCVCVMKRMVFIYQKNQIKLQQEISLLDFVLLKY